ncbi:hypothetical protein D3C72_1972650 [compost metagenome]
MEPSIQLLDWQLFDGSKIKWLFRRRQPHWFCELRFCLLPGIANLKLERGGFKTAKTSFGI